MKPSENIFLLAVLTVTYLCNTSFAIYDPRQTHAVKPAKRREFPSLWYSPSSTTLTPIEPQVFEGVKGTDLGPEKPVVLNNGAHTYSKYGTYNENIEQQSTKIFHNNYDRGQDVQRENSDFQHRYDQDQNIVYSDQNSYYGNGWFIDNADNHKSYEDFAIEIKKPYKDTKDFRVKPVTSIKVAKYDSETEAVCPTSYATGQFVYPPDCKFFVNCWNGRAFVQPCAPGTLFNPETLECDFPTKVQCYGSELVDLNNPYNIPPSATKQPSQISEPQREWTVPSLTNQHPSCPPSFTGLLPHPTDCAKFLQCANGVTFIMDCGPGTVFNPAISVCDWPYNVKGCEDALKLKTDPTSVPVWKGIDVRSDFSPQVLQKRIEPEVVTCPEGEEGLLRHPTDCKKFLQCSNGNTNIMDCGPGTVFNPLMSVCDFADNVEGCGEDLRTTTEISQFGINSYVGNSGSQSETGFDHRTHWGAVPNVPNNQKFDIRKDYENNSNRGDQNSNPTGNWHPYYNDNKNEGNSNDKIDQGKERQTESSLSGNFNGNPNTYDNDPNLGQSNTHNFNGDQYGLDQNIYVDSNYKLPSEEGNPDESKKDGKEFVVTPATPESVISQQSWNQPETFVNQPGRFKPSSWTGQEKEGEHPSNPVVNHEWSQGSKTIDVNKKLSAANSMNVLNALHQNSMFYNKHKPDTNTAINNNPSYLLQNNQKPFSRYQPNNNALGSSFINKQYAITNQGHGQEYWYATEGNVDVNETYGGITYRNFSSKNMTRTRILNTDEYSNTTLRNRNSSSRVVECIIRTSKELPSVKTDLLGPSSGKIDLADHRKKDLDLDSKLDQWAIRTNVFHHVPTQPGTKTVTRQRKTDEKNFHYRNSTDLTMNNQNWYPSGIYVNVNGIQGHYITKEIEINQGHSNAQKYGNNNGFSVVAEEERDYDTTEKNILHTEIEFDSDKDDDEKLYETKIEHTTHGSTNTLVETETSVENKKIDKDDRNITEGSKTSSIMKITNQEIDLDIFGVEFVNNKGEPPFPVYFVQGVQPINGWSEWINITPISGQVLRLRGGSVLEEGYLEVQGTEPGWGIVCDHRNAWNLKKANIVCRQLGYTRGAVMAWQGNNNQNKELPWVAADSVDCIGNETYFQSCKFTHNPYCDVARDAVGIRCLPNRAAYCRKDEIPHKGFCYHLANPDTALNHPEALDHCNSKGAKLVDVLDQSENNFISEWLVQRHPYVNSIMTSGFGFTTLNRTVWLWEDTNHAKFRFGNWWPGWMQDKRLPPSVGSRPACVVMKRIFPCHNRPDESCLSDYFFWDIEDCATSSKGHSHICKRVYNDIGCVYGKGQHYLGKANITESGAHCLPWNDEAIEQHLRFKVVSDEIREKLKEHDYCRNPNPSREVKPWCFTGLNGEYEHCDIPPCAKQGMRRTVTAGRCKPKHFECTPGECIPSLWICDGEEDCSNGADEQACSQHLEFYTKIEQHHLDDHDVEKWLNTPLKTCALRCKEADFTCRSFSHKADGNVCLLSDSNIGLTGDLQPSIDYDYYEMNERSINCSDMFVCGNGKCINQSLLCDGKNNCGDRTDESSCNLESYGYEIRLSGSNNTNQGRVEVKVWGKWGQVCDDGFGMIAANVACKELGFIYGAQEVRPAGFYGNADSQLFLMDQLKCRGNETSLRECDFDGWGVHNCLPEEAVGIVCKTAVNTCQDGFWKCDNSPECIPTPFICDEVVDCNDRSDEGPEHCEAPFELRLSGGSNLLEGRVEVRHHGIWGTVCDDDFSDKAATVICRSLGYEGQATAIKNGAFGPGDGPIWLDEVFCSGNETQLYRCDHENWGRHNCGHDEDVGVRCKVGELIRHETSLPYLPEVTANDILPTDCGKRNEDFDENDEYMARVIQGSVAQKGAYPWQASLRVRGHSRSNHWCGAVIISPLYVLTAAHCLEGYNKGMYFVRAGDYNTEVDDGTEVEANIENYYIHEDFRKGQRMNNDIALVMLKGQGIPLGRNIMPICLPPENVEYLPGLNCTISGWGSIESGKSVQSHFLRFGWVPILDQSVCQADYVYGEGAISDGMVCAGYLNEGVDSCDGDSGGPLACFHNNAFTLYGLTSWGKHCGEANKPGVYVRVAHYKKWIEEKIQTSSARM
ncbi:uncharacterized protein LOC124403977 isoform X2 [Diprion similis]|uniref:uncharacterized protein LOC124403977 isoform X2 n=1 Tax=Diprion similis TaxID=362088 RepID=UPI001EF9A9CE|nr:uncharacterized protein LOC124403977 isoform X2 [Diprion similis]